MTSVDKIAKDGAKKHFDEGKKLLNKGTEKNSQQDIEGAIAQLSKAIFLQENVPEYFELRGQAYLLLRDYKSAVSNFSQCLKMRRNEPEGLIADLRRKTSNLLVAEGLSRLQAREFGDAVHLFTSALETDNTNIYVHVHISLAKIGQQKLEEALKGLNTFLECTSSPKAKLPIHILVARLNKQLKSPTLASHHVHEALAIDPSSPEALNLYAQLKGRAGELYNEATDLLLRNEPRMAIDCLTHAVDLDDQDARFLVRRGIIHRQLGQYNEAVADLEKVLELTKHSDEDAKRQLAITFNQLGIELYAARDLSQALSVYNLALKHDPKAASIWINRGDCYREQLEVGLALSDYLKAHELNPSDRDTRIRLSTLFDARGLTYFDRGALHEAVLEFGAAIKYLPQVPHYYLHRATACMDAGDLQQAVADYKQVVVLDPSNEHAWARLQGFGDVSAFSDKVRQHHMTKAAGRGQAAAGRRAGSASSLAPTARTRESHTRTLSAQATLSASTVGSSGDASGHSLGGGGHAGGGGGSGREGGETGRVREPRMPQKDRSPTRQSQGELRWLASVVKQHAHTRSSLRCELGYKSDRRLDTRGIDGKYRDPKTGLPISSIVGLENPYPSPSLR